MNRFLHLFVAALAAGPLLAHAQSAQNLTREQVHQDMIRYEAAGFNPARANPRTWVDDAQAAAARVNASRDVDGRTRLADHGATATRCD
ncbi:DUF4148 domain-containing protein [Burkholderia sp. Bp9017]|uniref:DUF4148 domain-containing protein n=1 Tax=Burkholderia TaxID=32008 RepID=UPI000F5F3FD3|nr:MULTISPECIES: DUF4148 domain-containing protein [Burkholderia]MBY4871004.1 DUF4148 domain-containing protein [Burkholderia anthina]RQZ13904.1 DUF4148 domain-containing protein [Burkholderia sp. Bp9017]